MRAIETGQHRGHQAAILCTTEYFCTVFRRESILTGHSAKRPPVFRAYLLLDVNAQLVAVLLLDLLVAELFGLVHSAIELRNQTLSPTLRQRAFFLGLVLPGYSTLVVWRLNYQCALWHLYNITKSGVFPRQYSVTQHPADVLRLGLSHNLAGELSSPCPATNANLRFQCYCSHAFLCSL